jgi:hypothetical protein
MKANMNTLICECGEALKFESPTWKYCPICARRIWSEEELKDRHIRTVVEKAKNERYIISIDSGSRGIGYAIWGYNDFTELVPPWKAGHVTPKADEWYDGITETLAAVNSICTGLGTGDTGFGCMRIYVEMPEFRDTSTGHAIAKRGSLLKLAVATGAFSGFAWYTKSQFVPVTPTEWKGQLPKEVVISRIKAKFPLSPAIHTLKSHAWDAVGIGLYAKGYF